MRASVWILGVLVGGCTAQAASDDSSCRDGDLGCLCYGNGTCNADLVCAGTRCEASGAAPGADSGAGVGSGPGAQPGADAGAGQPDAAPEEESCSLLAPTFTQSTTIPKGCWLVQATPSMPKDAVLTLGPGAKLKFTAGAGLRFGDDQTFRAVGTAADPILLTGEKATPGAWIGVQTLSNGVRVEMEHVTIEYAGGGGDAEAAGLQLEGPERAQLSHITLRQNSNWGFNFYLYYSAVVMRDSLVTGNSAAGGHVAGDWSELPGVFDETTQFHGNGQDCIVDGLWYEPDEQRPATPGVPFCP